VEAKERFTRKSRLVSGRPNRRLIGVTPISIFSTIYTPEESLGRPPPAGTPAALTHDLTLAFLTTKPNQRGVVTVLIKTLCLIKKCGYGSYAVDVDRFARKTKWALAR
jgi:hypothetical protein